MRVGLNVNQKRATCVLWPQRLLDCVLELSEGCDLDARATAGSRDCNMVERTKMTNTGVRAKTTLLGVDLKSQYTVIQDDDRDTNAMSFGRLHLGPAMGKPAISS